MEAYILDWLSLLARWLHFTAGVAWIGTSFYFVMLDNSLAPPRKDEDAARGVFGELWAVHGGGFYVSQKFLTGPKGETLPASLHWSKWEAYTTWLSGMGLLALVYWYGASTFLIDPSVLPISQGAAVAISIAFIGGGWVVYEALCRMLGRHEGALSTALFLLVIVVSWGLFDVFGARAAYLHVGAVLGTIMVANVSFHIIPGQKRMVADIRSGREPDPTPGLIGKQRSVHNTYFTLPVLFTMISSHYPMTYSRRHGWAVLIVIVLAGVLFRQYFVLRHKGKTVRVLPIVATLLLVALAVAIAPKAVTTSGSVDIGRVSAILSARCVPCHASNPTQTGFLQPPKGIVLQSAKQIEQNADKIAETVANRYMPIGNLTAMTEEERETIATWFAQRARR